MTPELNMAHGHENPHALPIDSILDMPEMAKTTNLERMHLLPEVLRLMSSNEVTNRFTLWLEPRLIFRSDRALQPMGLEHWSSESCHKVRLAVRAAEGAREFDTVMFRVMKSDDIPGCVCATILDWRTFRLGQDPDEDQDLLHVFEHLRHETNGFLCTVDGNGMICIQRDGLVGHSNMPDQEDHIIEVLTWFGKLIADPSAFDTDDLSLDDEFWD